MSEPKFTPGPWEWVPNDWRGGLSGIASANGQAVLFPNHCNDGDCGDAWFEDYPSPSDANLIAAAPDLYWALRQAAYVLADYEGQIGVDHTMIGVRKALAKVEGKP